RSCATWPCPRACAGPWTSSRSGGSCGFDVRWWPSRPTFRLVIDGRRPTRDVARSVEFPSLDLHYAEGPCREGREKIAADCDEGDDGGGHGDRVAKQGGMVGPLSDGGASVCPSFRHSELGIPDLLGRGLGLQYGPSQNPGRLRGKTWKDSLAPGQYG